MQTYDIIVVTDGSGYEDFYGGWAAVAFTPDRIYQMLRMGGVSGTTVDRAEFTGMLEGMQMAVEIWNALPWRGLTGNRPRPKVLWISDRENLVLSAKKVQSRSNSPDLWARYEYYEYLLDIHPEHREYDKVTSVEFPDCKIVDLNASIGRGIFKSYVENSDLPKNHLVGIFT